VRGNETKNKLRDLASAADLIVKSFDFRCQTSPTLREFDHSLAELFQITTGEVQNAQRFVR
jgi:hypothetical protein